MREQRRKEGSVAVEVKQEVVDSQISIKKGFKNEKAICCMKCCLDRMKIEN